MEIFGRWDVWGWLLAFFVSGGLAMMSLNSFKTTKVFFGISSAILVFRVAMFGVSPSTTTPIKIACIAICGLIAVLTYFLFRWVDRKAGAFGVKSTAIGQTVDSSTNSINVANTGVIRDINLVSNSIHQHTVERPKDSTVSAADWERLAEKFKQFPWPIRADCQTTRGVNRWDVKESKECEVLCKKAGAMLMKSPTCLSTLDPSLVNEGDHLKRWLGFVKSKTYFRTMGYATENLDDGSVLVHHLGSIDDLAKKSSSVCMECSANET